MSRLNLSVGLILATLLFLQACTPAYVPTRTNTPMFTDAGEIQTSFTLGSSGIDLQLAYAATENIGLIGNSSFNSSAESSTGFHKHLTGELGAGYFLNIDESNLFEVYAGVGIGVHQAPLDSFIYASNQNISSIKYFLQPTYGVIAEQYKIGFSPKLVYTKFTQGTISSGGFIIEPTMTGQFGAGNFKFIFQIGLSRALNPDAIKFSTHSILFTTGLHLNI